MIVKNEEKVLARCLESVKDIADEIIIVDTGSTDKTKEIALQFTDKVFDFTWIDDFSAARNFSFSKATMQYQMWLDADDVILPEDKEKILKLKKELTNNIDIVTFKYNTGFDSEGRPIQTSTRGRLFKRDGNYAWLDPIHEYIELKGNLFHADNIFITHKKEPHFSDRNIKIYETQIASGKILSPRGLYYYARELKDHKRYIESIYYFHLFLDTKQGWLEDNIAACYNLGICYKLINNNEKAIESLIKSFHYDFPRAEICCEIGYYYKHKGEYHKAIKWFETAIMYDKPNTLGFILNDCWDYTPCIELTVCFDKIGNIEKAKSYNEKAAKFKPDSKAVKYNRDYFNSLKS